MGMKPTKKRLINKNDELARRINLLVHKNMCCRCGRSGDVYKLDWSHVFGRSTKVLRWEEDNGMLHCFTCHAWWHDNPLVAAEWFESQYPGRKARLQEKLNLAHPMKLKDYQDINDQLTKRLAEL